MWISLMSSHSALFFHLSIQVVCWRGEGVVSVSGTTLSRYGNVKPCETIKTTFLQMAFRIKFPCQRHWHWRINSRGLLRHGDAFFFNLMEFSRKIAKNIKIGGWRPIIWEILDQPLIRMDSDMVSAPLPPQRSPQHPTKKSSLLWAQRYQGILPPPICAYIFENYWWENHLCPTDEECQTICCSLFSIILHSLSTNLTCQFPMWANLFLNAQLYICQQLKCSSFN